VALIALVAFVAIVGVVLGVPRVRKHVLPPTRNALSAVWSVLRSPHRLALLLGSNNLIALMTAAVYEACLAAFGASANFWTLVSLLIVMTTIASLVPNPRRPHRRHVSRHVRRARGRRRPHRSRSRRRPL
jgi:hypothetical protein